MEAIVNRLEGVISAIFVFEIKSKHSPLTYSKKPITAMPTFGWKD